MINGKWQEISFATSSPNAYAGNTGIEVTTLGQWGRIQLLAESNFKFTTTGYESLSFAINIGAYEGEELYVGLIGSNGDVIAYKMVSPYTGSKTLDAYQWQPVYVPLSDLGVSSTDVYGVEIQSSTPATFYVDEIQFLNTNGGSCNAE
ncbi:MAG: hypothetical protein Q7S11_00030 [bacterium]|nr:hypothetical protein [bacterium]